uniref:WAT1-related protein n=1 Tax=Kalanchoe fedtschenkoi TaxID=63787 RepID=A0A7N0TRJ2_KALFE
MIAVAIMGSFIQAEKIFLGGIVGSVLIVIGLYSVLWGKHEEVIDEKSCGIISDEEIPEAIKHATANGNGNTMSSTMETIEHDEDDVESQKAEAHKLYPSLQMSK